MGRFSDAMKMVGSGEGWETNYLANAFPLGNLGVGHLLSRL